jgi:choloylglycine hydrolase
MEYHTMHNRRVRQVDLKKIDFSKPQQLVRMPLDQKKEQDIEIVIPKM